MRANPFEPDSNIGRRSKQSKDLGFDEIYLDSLTEETTVVEGERYHPNLGLLLVFLLLGFGLVLSRIYFLQVVKGDEFRNLAEGNKLRVSYVLAPRGQISDKNGKVVAANIPSFELSLNAADLPKDQSRLEQELAEVASILGQETGQIQEIVSKSRKDGLGLLTVAQNLSKDQALILISKEKELPGFVVSHNPIRDYKDAPIFSHLIGYSGKITEEEFNENKDKNYLLNDNIGKTGLEVYYEDYLRGIPGRKQIEIDAVGKFRKTLPEVPAQPGKNLKLNIDYDLQKEIFDSLNFIMRRGSARKAAAVATDPVDGRVLAFVSLPGFDSNWFARGISSKEYQSLIDDPNNPLFNRLISGTYPPGSTVKPMLAIAALTEKVITPQTKILDDGVIQIGQFTFYGYNPKGLGLMDVYSAIARSSDIFFYTVGGGSPKTTIQGLGPEKLAEWYRKFNLGQRLGIDLPHEKTGLVPDPVWKKQTRNEPWYLGDTYHYSIGQGDLLVTPLQVNSWTATIANGGKIMQPFIVDEILDLDGKVVMKNEPKVIRENFLDPQWVKVSQDGMRQAVTAGSARSLSSLPIAIAGKTGTAQFDSRNPSRTHAWFTSFAPFESPKIALTILIESGGEGSSVAVPVARQVYEWWAKNR